MHTIHDILEVKGHEVYATGSDSTVSDAVVEMCRLKVGALLVLDDLGDPVGILSERDLMTRVLLAHRDPGTTTVGDVMTRRVVCADEDDTLSEAMSRMTRAHCRHLPVVRQGLVGGVSGMVSIGDLMRAANSDHEYELRVLHDYVEGRYPG
jgi:signal-transduction protein with cAMP-binding, CBS, and nucleotidyltransferase domain